MKTYKSILIVKNSDNDSKARQKHSLGTVVGGVGGGEGFK